MIRGRPWAPPLGLPREARGTGRAREGEEGRREGEKKRGEGGNITEKRRQTKRKRIGEDGEREKGEESLMRGKGSRERGIM